MKIKKRDRPLHITPSRLKLIRKLFNDPNIIVFKLRQRYNLQIFFRDCAFTKFKNRMWDIGTHGKIESSFYDEDWDLVGYYLDGKIKWY